MNNDERLEYLRMEARRLRKKAEDYLLYAHDMEVMIVSLEREQQKCPLCGQVGNPPSCTGCG